MKKLFLGLVLLSFSTISLAGEPVCSSGSGGYCNYSGKVKRIYVNAGNLILLYFDTAFDPSEASVAGYTVTNGGAAAVVTTENPEFAKLFYSTALAAQASQRNVTVQMRGTYGGYLKIDRIWLEEQ